ncbi:DUF664 domain-containing protein [Arthrobacter sp. NEB 688]|uniref:mycothiol transferase n=1 Tax=Arthrobacter sp. NEB 688 TaxID=904039 RepID=UPI001563A9FA|nr:DUF664 domain-containing protein [Arthrobacter sp. NEB 688]QKE84149.1 DUF664 domain-containing protein [Arthrobacter sp. NEB 688]
MTAADELLASCTGLLDQYEALCRDLGDDLVSARPEELPGSNSAFALVAHVAGVMARWGRTVNRGRPVPRDRDAEFRATGTVEEALALLGRARRELVEDVRAATLDAPPAAPPADDPHAYPTQGAVLLHVHEELAQHLGQLEVTRDVLLERARRDEAAR